MAIMADFGRLQTRQKVIVFVLIGALLGLVYWKLLYGKLKENLVQAEQDHDERVARNEQLPKDIKEYELLNSRLTSLKRLIDENAKALPTEAELPAFFETLNRKVIESGIEVVRSSQGKEEPVERFIKVPINYEIQGTFVQFKKFFASLLPKKKKPGQPDAPAGDQSVEERERIVSIENLSLTNPVVRNREIQLTARFTASTYRQVETPGEPVKKAVPKAAPLPPANTPKGAKARVEDSLQKSEDRAKGKIDEKPPDATGSERMKGGL